ncbi:MAG TPA: hypothetical protein VKX49_12565 [Bryobacteraceae bacterium]|nr:hypothetical protein [Bryobacteraceae bacterium]
MASLYVVNRTGRADRSAAPEIRYSVRIHDLGAKASARVLRDILLLAVKECSVLAQRAHAKQVRDSQGFGEWRDLLLSLTEPLKRAKMLKRGVLEIVNLTGPQLLELVEMHDSFARPEIRKEYRTGILSIRREMSAMAA